MVTEMQSAFEKQRLVELTGISEDKLTELEAASFVNAALVEDDEVQRCQGLGLREGQRLLAVRDYLSNGNEISSGTTILKIIARNKAFNAEQPQYMNDDFPAVAPAPAPQAPAPATTTQNIGALIVEGFNSLQNSMQTMQTSMQALATSVQSSNQVGVSQQLQNDQEKIDYMFARMKLAEEDEKTLLLSKPSEARYSRAVQDIGLRIDAPKWDQDESTKKKCLELGRRMAPFGWKAGKEDSEENRGLYMAYLKNTTNLCLPVGSKLFDGAKAGAFLSVEFVPYGIKTRGNIDVVMAADRHQEIHTTIKNMWAAIELKKQDNNANNEIRRQVILQHLSASFLNKETGILTIMTDLGPRWHFYWFSKEQNALMEYQATSKGEANYLIRHMMEDMGATSAPTDFLNRASWKQMFPSHMEGGAIMEESEGEDGEDHVDEGDHQTLHSLDFMDEEEEMEAKITDVLECLLPQLGLFPSHGQLQPGQQADSPPRQIELS